MSTRPSGTVCSARSHAANHGYSHLSGIEITSPASRWNQDVLRMPGFPAGLRPGIDVVLAEPAVDVVLVVLLAPEQPGERLARHVGGVRIERGADHRRVELVGLRAPCREHAARSRRRAAARRVPRRAGRGRHQAHAHDGARAGLEHELVQGRHLGAPARGVDRAGRAVHDVVVDAVLGVVGDVRRAEDALVVRLVLAEQELGGVVAEEQPLAELGVRRMHVPVAVGGGRRAFERRRLAVGRPRPRVAEPERRKQRAALPPSGPRLCAVTSTRMSSGAAFAYSQNTSK